MAPRVQSYITYNVMCAVQRSSDSDARPRPGPPPDRFLFFDLIKNEGFECPPERETVRGLVAKFKQGRRGSGGSVLAAHRLRLSAWAVSGERL